MLWYYHQRKDKKPLNEIESGNESELPTNLVANQAVHTVVPERIITAEGKAIVPVEVIERAGKKLSKQNACDVKHWPATVHEDKIILAPTEGKIETVAAENVVPIPLKVIRLVDERGLAFSEELIADTGNNQEASAQTKRESDNNIQVDQEKIDKLVDDSSSSCVVETKPKVKKASQKATRTSIKSTEVGAGMPITSRSGRVLTPSRFFDNIYITPGKKASQKATRTSIKSTEAATLTCKFEISF